MANNITPKLKAYVQTDATGRVVSGTPVFRSSKPKDGNWREIPMYYRGDTPSSTTTTTTSGGSTPTAFIQDHWISGYNSCVSTTEGTILLYSASTTLQAGVAVFQDAALTTPVEQGYIIPVQVGPGQYQRYVVGTFGILSAVNCANQSLIQDFYQVSSNPTFACEGSGVSMQVAVPDTGIATAAYVSADFGSYGFPPNSSIAIRYNVGGTNYTRQFSISSSNPGIANIINGSRAC